MAITMRRPRHHDRHHLAIDRPNRPPLRQSRTRRHPRSLHRPNPHPTNRRPHNHQLHQRPTRTRASGPRKPTTRPTSRRDYWRKPTTSSRDTMAATSHTSQRAPRLQKPATHDCERAWMVRAQQSLRASSPPMMIYRSSRIGEVPSYFSCVPSR